MTAITERVSLGAAFLDEWDPDWWREGVPNAIDLDALDLNDVTACVLGQRCPLEVLGKFASSCGSPLPCEQDRYYAYVTELTRVASVAVHARDHWARAHGFSLVMEPYGSMPGDSDWAELTDVWRVLIQERRKLAADGTA